MDLVELHTIMATGCFEIMEHGALLGKAQDVPKTGLKFNICGLESSYVANNEVSSLSKRIETAISPELKYASNYWLHHLEGILFNPNISGSDLLLQAVQDLLCTIRSLYWLEVMSLTDNLVSAKTLLMTISQMAEVRSRPLLLLMNH